MDIRYQFIFSFITFSCFSIDNITPQNFIYDSQDIATITKILFGNASKKDIAKQFCFMQGLTHFCKEKNIAPFAVIGCMSNHGYSDKSDAKEEIITKSFYFMHTAFPTGAILTEVNRYYYEKSSYYSIQEYRLNVTKTMTPEMKQFIDEMIEKGKSSQIMKIIEY